MWTRGFDVAEAVETLKDFAGVRRRFDRVGEAGGITIVDDYAHHLHRDRCHDRGGQIA